ncbi:SDR family NAD(P)-dependent oxidoreductase [Mycobacterium sp. 2YAF39]|uniref:SDR family NAD(P)-dependent oxidoreductase n=1 Tax=Mycobacterium sp. 2YAF39 TaxID=3233033 RepID=UPI003F9DB357
MDTLNDKVVVVTGGASGIGLALAKAVTGHGARVVIADVEQAALDAARDSGELPADTLMVTTDVSDPASVSDLRDAVLDRHGRVDVLCNNAGVSTFNMLADQTLDDWNWVLGVNLWGVIHGIAAFLPLFRSQGTPAHIVNTSSVAGLVSGIAFLGPYAVSKVGVVAISETLRQEMAITGEPIGVSVVCPSATDTKVMEAERNRPSAMESEHRTQDAENWRLGIKAGFTGPDGLTPAAVADRIVDAVLTDRFWVITHSDLIPAYEARFTEILANSPGKES